MYLWCNSQDMCIAELHLLPHTSCTQCCWMGICNEYSRQLSIVRILCCEFMPISSNRTEVLPSGTFNGRFAFWTSGLFLQSNKGPAGLKLFAPEPAGQDATKLSLADRLPHPKRTSILGG